MTLSQRLGTPCHCTTIRLPLGAHAVYDGTRLHRADACFDTDDLDGFDVEVPR